VTGGEENRQTNVVQKSATVKIFKKKATTELTCAAQKTCPLDRRRSRHHVQRL